MNEYISREELLQLQIKFAMDELPDIKMKIALVNNLLPEVQLILSKDSLIKKYLASNPNLTPEVQKILVEDSDEWIRANLAENPNLISDVQQVLAKDSSTYVRYDLAGNPNLIPEVQQTLAKDLDNSVRCYLAENPNLTSETQEILVKDFKHVLERKRIYNEIETIGNLKIKEDSHKMDLLPLAIIGGLALLKTKNTLDSVQEIKINKKAITK